MNKIKKIALISLALSCGGKKIKSDMMQSSSKNQNYNYYKLDKSFFKAAVENANKISNLNSKGDSIVISGPTGSGKSTFTNYLRNINLEYHKENFIEVLKVKQTSSNYYKNKQIAPIGHSISSKTQKPTPYYDPQTNIAFIDLPGFFDSNSNETNIQNHINNSFTIRNLKKIKSILFTIPLDGFIDTRGELLKKGFLDILLNMISLEKRSRILPSIYMIVTKSERFINKGVDKIKTIIGNRLVKYGLQYENYKDIIFKFLRLNQDEKNPKISKNNVSNIIVFQPLLHNKQVDILNKILKSPDINTMDINSIGDGDSDIILRKNINGLLSSLIPSQNISLLLKERNELQKKCTELYMEYSKLSDKFSQSRFFKFELLKQHQLNLYDKKGILDNNICKIKNLYNEIVSKCSNERSPLLQHRDKVNNLWIQLKKRGVRESSLRNIVGGCLCLGRIFYEKLNLKKLGSLSTKVFLNGWFDLKNSTYSNRYSFEKELECRLINQYHYPSNPLTISIEISSENPSQQLFENYLANYKDKFRKEYFDNIVNAKNILKDITPVIKYLTLIYNKILEFDRLHKVTFDVENRYFKFEHSHTNLINTQIQYSRSLEEQMKNVLNIHSKLTAKKYNIIKTINKYNDNIINDEDTLKYIRIINSKLNLEFDNRLLCIEDIKEEIEQN